MDEVKIKLIELYFKGKLKKINPAFWDQQQKKIESFLRCLEKSFFESFALASLYAD